MKIIQLADHSFFIYLLHFICLDNKSRLFQMKKIIKLILLQVMASLLATDRCNNPDIIALNGGTGYSFFIFYSHFISSFEGELYITALKTHVDSSVHVFRLFPCTRKPLIFQV